MEKNKKYKFDGEYTEESLLEFAKSIVDGTAASDYKSADIPEEPLDEGVTVIVGKNFDSIVMDKTKDVLLEVGERRLPFGFMLVVCNQMAIVQASTTEQTYTQIICLNQTISLKLFLGLCPLVRPLQEARPNLLQAGQAVCVHRQRRHCQDGRH